MATKFLAGVFAAFLATGFGVYVAFSSQIASGEQADALTLTESPCCAAKAPACCAAEKPSCCSGSEACCAESEDCCPAEALAACAGAAACTPKGKATPHCCHE